MVNTENNKSTVTAFDASNENMVDACKKIISRTQIPENENIESFIANFPIELGEVKAQGAKLEIFTPREMTMEASKYLLNNISISDLNIHERPIGDIIENIMQGHHLA